jgi:hypothetical protein
LNVASLSLMRIPMMVKPKEEGKRVLSDLPEAGQTFGRVVQVTNEVVCRRKQVGPVVRRSELGCPPSSVRVHASSEHAERARSKREQWIGHQQRQLMLPFCEAKSPSSSRVS